jgi:hypothetical protein
MIRVGTKHQRLIHGAGCACHSPQMGQVTQRLTAFNRRGFLAGLTATAAAAGLPGPLLAQAPRPAGRVLFRQIRLFDGKSDSLRDNAPVLVEGNRIASVDFAGHSPPADAKIIDCGGRVMTPGLIDAHWHTLFAALPLQALLTADAGYIYLAATVESRNTLLRGFTTVRDLGGPVFPFKQAIDDGIVVGPRIYPSGPMITTTGGHGDLRSLSDLPRIPGGPLSAVERTGGAAIADNIGEVQLRVREQLLQGASQLKLVAGGGVSSPRSPLDMTTFSEAELRAAVDVARDWNLCRRPRLRAAHDQARHRSRRRLYRARPSDGRGGRAADGREGRLAQHPAFPQRGGRAADGGTEPREGAGGHRRDAPRL